ncbi:hypothetical protein A11A3_05324 [Alcanivorax hongdengensis A-11-3]|uniref:tRNA threonylcarbamoyladenosine biosynthesis protein TsaB n=1 Tax=Alcanivorax hongdengensis A-11-3 TaxID=1177179 RepID=L0WG07_9GAMM|nr:tRNA (adenosine(37)-N6)-threonylcarbamoyltransferase complex dimerization subunit type 1 TsaB [Alcanivorax hongdengensis]EKF75087.1 hypothetical protein A11A3_05324 [Alcanivorax hongdengensis A-11-3]
MTRILALETAGETCSVALMGPDGDIIEQFESAPRRQTERVLPMVEQVLAEGGVRLPELDAIAFGHGPGAFTGVRVAAAVTQGLAFSADLPVVGISTLAACALTAADQFDHGDILAAFDARMGELYLGAYRRIEDSLQTVVADGLFDPHGLPDLPAGEWLVAGSGAVYDEALKEKYGALRLEGKVHPRASAIARLARAKVVRGEVVRAEQAQPVYLRDQVIQGAVR